MGEEILMCGDIKLKTKKFTAIKLRFFSKDVDIEKILVWCLPVKKTVNTLLVTCIMIITSHKISRWWSYRFL